MIFLDINTFYCPRAGGIRTYHLEKIEYFKSHSEHTYYLVFPGKKRESTNPASNIHLEKVFGIAAGRDQDGYRLILDYLSVFLLIKETKPDIVEAGDPWLTGLFCMLSSFPEGTKRTSFYHADPVDTYFKPWSNTGKVGLSLKKILAAYAGKVFYGLQKRYFSTLVTSDLMRRKLSEKKIPRVALLPFGIHPVFLEQGELRGTYLKEERKKIKLLYAGRLDKEKGMDLLIEAVPKLLNRHDVSLTVAGRGKFADYFSGMRGMGLDYLGFIDSREQMAEVIANHDVFLAPGPNETFGMGVLEALACGLIAVGPDSGGTGEILTGMGSDFIFKAGDADSFYEKIRMAIKCNLKEEFTRSRKAAKAFGSWDRAINRMVRYYEDLRRDQPPSSRLRRHYGGPGESEGMKL
ncbi:glycosyltransferase [Fibrobacterota bacterium]